MSVKANGLRPELNNRQIILLALLLQGGASEFVDLEDIAFRAYDLAPTRFRWNKYDYPSVELARQAFKHWKDLKAEEPRFTSHRQSYMLNGPGVRDAVETASVVFGRAFSSADDVLTFYRDNVAGENKNEVKRSTSENTRTTARPSQHELRRIKSHALYKRWLSGENSFEIWELADLLNCLPGSSKRVWDERFGRLDALAEFWQDKEFLEFLRVIRKHEVAKK